MRSSRPIPALLCPSQNEIDALLRAAVEIMSIATPAPMQVAIGLKAQDGLFEPDETGSRWFAFPDFDGDDIVFWCWSTGELASWSGRAFALGEDIIGEALTYSFDGHLNIYADPLTWLRARRDGIVILPNRWPDAFERLRDAPRIAIEERLLPLYRRHMRPIRFPELLVIPQRRRAA